MKRTLSLFVATICAIATWAYDFKVNNIYYSKSYDNVVEVTSDTQTPYSGSVVIPATVRYNGTTYTVKYIDNEAFAGCNKLTSITIPEGVKFIGRDAFKDCTALTAITIPSSVKEIGERAFRGCSSLSSALLSEGLEEIKEWAFFDCSRLAYIRIPNSLKRIGSGAFMNCSLLASITIPDSVRIIGAGILKGTAIYNNLVNWENGAFYIDDCLLTVKESTAGDFQIRENTRLIANWAFGNCQYLISVTIPSGIKAIPEAAFAECYSLRYVELSEGIT